MPLTEPIIQHTAAIAALTEPLSSTVMLHMNRSGDASSSVLPREPFRQQYDQQVFSILKRQHGRHEFQQVETTVQVANDCREDAGTG
jgi:hypothetical protein